MRIDKYLKLSRIIKRRVIAKEACESGKIFINGIRALPSDKIDVGDKIDVHFGSEPISIIVRDIKEYVPKDSAFDLYEIISKSLSEKPL